MQIKLLNVLRKIKNHLKIIQLKPCNKCYYFIKIKRNMGGGYSTSSSESDRPAFNSCIPLPRPLDVNDDIVVNFEVFKLNWKNYVEESGLEKQSIKFQTTILINALGNDATVLYFQNFEPLTYNCASPAVLFRNIEREILPAIVRKKMEKAKSLNLLNDLQEKDYYPEPLNVRSGDIVENVKKFQLDCFVYWSIQQINGKTFGSINANKLTDIKSALGPDGQKYYDKIENNFSTIEKCDPILLLKALVRELPNVIFMERKRYNRSLFYAVKQMKTESFLEYFGRINELIKYCYFGSMEDDFLIDKIICSVSNEKLKTELLNDEKMSLQQVLDKCTKFNKYREFDQLIKKHPIVDQGNKENVNANSEKPNKKSKLQGNYFMNFLQIAI